MTGSEAWSLVAPILTSHMANIPHETMKNDASNYAVLNCLDEAYVTVFGALKEYDERRNHD